MGGEGEASKASKGRILVVDDDPTLCDLLVLILERQGYDVVTATSGREALEQITLRRPDLITLDLKMSDIDGWYMLRHLKECEITASIPVLVVSAKADRASIRSALEEGASDYLTKPFVVKEMISHIGRLLPRAESEAQFDIPAGLPGPEMAQERLTELVFDTGWTVLLLRIEGRAHISQVANLLAQAQARFVGRWSETEFVLILGRREFGREYDRIIHAALPISLGIVEGDTVGSFADAEDIVAEARRKLTRLTPWMRCWMRWRLRRLQRHAGSQPD